MTPPISTCSQWLNTQHHQLCQPTTSRLRVEFWVCLSVHSVDVPSVSMLLLIWFSSFLKQSKDPATRRVINTMSPSTLMENHSLAGRSTPASACGAAGLKGAVDVDTDGKRHRLPFCHQPSVACLSTFAAVKRSKRWFDILYTSRARTPTAAPPTQPWKCYGDGDESWMGRLGVPVCLPWIDFPQDSERRDLSVIVSMSGTFPSG